MEKVGLVLEGGAMRGMYTAGVLDTLMDNKIKVDGIIGSSAGALFGPNYFSKQKGRVIRYNKRFCKNRRYMSLWNFIFTGNVIGKKFAFYDITTKHDIFDNETFMKNNTGFYASATNVETGKAEYLSINNVIEDMEKLRATSAIPLVSKMVKINGKKYLDGGVSDSIPIMKCKKLGYDKIIVVLTQPDGYRKTPLSSRKVKMINKKYKKYPNLIKTMMHRHEDYNNIVNKISKMEQKKEIFVIRPSQKINVNVIERNPDKLQAIYELGVKDTEHLIDDLKLYLQKCK